MVIVGLDVSLEHSGFCILSESGEMQDYLYFSNVEKEYNADPEHCVFLDLKRGKEENRDSYRARRLSTIVKKVDNFLTNIFLLGNKLYPGPIYFCLEDYAYNSASTALCQIAEFTGHIKNQIYNYGGKLRFHDPRSIKYFSVGKGNATKFEMVTKAKTEPEFICNAPVKTVHSKKKPDDYDGPLTDVVDAYYLARLMWFELMLRSGKIALSSLPEYQMLTFNRVTKPYPINILARDFIQKDAEKNSYN